MDQACLYEGEYEHGRFSGAGIYDGPLGKITTLPPVT